MCAKSCGSVSSVSGEGEFLHELEEKMEVRKRKNYYMYNVIFDLYLYIVCIEEDVLNYILLFLSFLFSFTMCIKWKFHVLHESVNVHKTTCTCTHKARDECFQPLLYTIYT